MQAFSLRIADWKIAGQALLPPPQRKRGLQQKPWQLQGNEPPIPIASRFPAILESARGF